MCQPWSSNYFRINNIAIYHLPSTILIPFIKIGTPNKDSYDSQVSRVVIFASVTVINPQWVFHVKYCIIVIETLLWTYFFDCGKMAKVSFDIPGFPLNWNFCRDYHSISQFNSNYPRKNDSFLHKIMRLIIILKHTFTTMLVRILIYDL